MKDKAKRCYLYSRVSTLMQVDGYSLDAQREILRKEANHRNMQVVAEFTDEGKSGKNVSGRPQFLEMMERIENGNADKVDYILVFKLSRFGRNTEDVLRELRIMQNHGVNLLSVEEGIDSAGATGKLMISIMASVSEIERENTLVQSMEGRMQKARMGKWNGGFAPYGYGLNNGVLIVCEEEAKVIRLIFEKYTQTSMGARGIAKWLNDNGYTKIRRQNGTKEYFGDAFVKKVLVNPVYLGKIAYGRRHNEKMPGESDKYHVVDQNEYSVYDGQHEAIIDEETWEIAQEKRARSAHKHEKLYSKEHEHVLSGLLKCPVCDAPMYGVVNRKKKKDGSGENYTDMWYYVCSNHKAVGGQKCTYKKHLRQDVINQQVEIILENVMSHSDLPNTVAEKVGAPSSLDEIIADKKRLESAKSKAEAKKAKILNKIRALDPDDDLYDSLYADLQSILREHIETIEGIKKSIRLDEIAIQNSASKQETARFVKELLSVMLDSISKLPYDMEKELMNALIDRVEVFPEPQENGQIVKLVRFKIPMEVNGNVYDQLEYAGTVGDVLNDNSLPNQNHVETVCLLVLRNPVTHVNIDVDVEELVQTGLKVSSLYISQTKRKCGLDVGDSYNKQKSENAKVPQCPPEKDKAIMDALRHFGMI